MKALDFPVRRPAAFREGKDGIAFIYFLLKFLEIMIQTLVYRIEIGKADDRSVKYDCSRPTRSQG